MGDFQPGEVVIDCEDPDDPKLIVFATECGEAEAVHVDEADATIAELNPEYPATDPVVECIHVDWLDRHANDDWDKWLGPSFPNYLEAYADEWNIPIRTYSYPVSRLRADTDESDSGQARLDQW